MAWGDYDNDGDLDILLTGLDSSAGRVAKVYRNDGGVLVDSGTADDALTGVGGSSVAWGDYDNDGDLDILLTGANSSNTPVTKLYRNDGPAAGSGWNFVDSGVALTGVSSSSVAWGDYDNDGDLDILLTGYSSDGVAKVYRNDGGVFVDSGQPMTPSPASFYSSVAWGDYDNDGDLDILLTGADSSFNPVARVYRNDGGVFVDSGADDASPASPPAAWPGATMTTTATWTSSSRARTATRGQGLPQRGVRGPGAGQSGRARQRCAGRSHHLHAALHQYRPRQRQGRGAPRQRPAQRHHQPRHQQHGGQRGAHHPDQRRTELCLDGERPGRGRRRRDHPDGTLSNSVALRGTQITNTATITASNDITATNNRASAAFLSWRPHVTRTGTARPWSAARPDTCGDAPRR